MDATAPASSCGARRGRRRRAFRRRADRRSERDRAPALAQPERHTTSSLVRAAQGHTVMTRRGLLATPLAVWERDGLKAALVKAGLPADDIGDPYLLAWRFESVEDIPVGFGCLEVYGYDALLRSVVTLPPLRQVGMGAAIVDVLEGEARARRCGAIYLLTTSQ